MVVYYTSRAWDNQDYFERNIVTLGGLGFTDDAEAKAYNEFVPNNARPTWPDITEVSRWAESINSYPALFGDAPSVNLDILATCLAAAIEKISDRTHIQVRPVDANGDVDELADPVKIPVVVKLATIMQAVRWARRPMTPDGIAGSSELGGIIRTSALDPDVEAMIGGELSLGLA